MTAKLAHLAQTMKQPVIFVKVSEEILQSGFIKLEMFLELDVTRSQRHILTLECWLTWESK